MMAVMAPSFSYPDKPRRGDAVTEYHPGVPLVIGADFGHTEPQYVIPSGGTVTVDGGTRQILVIY